MADYFYFDVTVKGSETNLNKLVKKCFSIKNNTYCFDFELLIPSPKRKEDCESKYLMGPGSFAQVEKDRPWFDWYKWNIANWGTKWNSCDNDQFELTKSSLSFYFSTAWSIPEPVIDVFFQLSANLNLSVKMHVTSDYNDDFKMTNSNYKPNNLDPTAPKPKKENHSILDDDFTTIVKKNKDDKKSEIDKAVNESDSRIKNIINQLKSLSKEEIKKICLEKSKQLTDHWEETEDENTSIYGLFASSIIMLLYTDNDIQDDELTLFNEMLKVIDLDISMSESLESFAEKALNHEKLKNTPAFVYRYIGAKSGKEYQEMYLTIIIAFALYNNRLELTELSFIKSSLELQ